jgi:hypothetical protein
MDYLRSAYSTTYHAFDHDGLVDTPGTLQWYRAPPHALEIGIHHQYASSNYLNGVNYPEQVGEVIGAVRTWKNGATPNGIVGVNCCDGVYDAQLNRLASPIGDNVFGQPLCCQVPAVCLACDLGEGLALYFVVATGGTGPFASANGRWAIAVRSPCFWTNFDVPEWQLNGFAGTFFQLTLSSGNPGGVAIWRIPVPYDCRVDHLTWPLFFSETPGQEPSIAVVRR